MGSLKVAAIHGVAKSQTRLSDFTFTFHFQVFYIYSIMSSSNSDSFTSSLPICIPFISFSCLIALAKKLNTVLNRSGESRHLCLFPDFRR